MTKATLKANATRNGAPARDNAPAHETPFVHRLQPTWGDSDPAQMVYTGRFPDFALRAIDAWLMANAGVNFYTMNADWGVGTPFVHLECDFRSPATPRDMLLIAVEVDKVGTTSLGFRVAATIEADGRLCFEGRFVCVCVDSRTQYKAGAKPMPLDARLREAAERDQARLAGQHAGTAGGK